MGLIPLCWRGVSTKNLSERGLGRHVSTADGLQETKRIRALLVLGLEGTMAAAQPY